MIRPFLAASLILALPACAESNSPNNATAAPSAPESTTAIQNVKKAKAILAGPDSKPLGSVTLTQTPAGVLLTAVLDGLPEGIHAFHIHTTGTCAPDFGAAKGHFAPNGESHGFLVNGGPHAGDMPNIHIPASGALTLEILNARISLSASQQDGTASTLFDEDGATIMIHAGADDYESQPSGAAGARIACGVIKVLH